MVPLDFLRAKIIYKVTWHKCFCSLCANIPQKKHATYFSNLTIITWLVNLSNQIQLHDCASYSYCARSWRQQTNPLRKKIFHRVENVIKQLVHVSACVRWDMKHLGSLESTKEARVALGYTLSNSYTSFMFSKLPVCFISQWTHADIWINC